MRYVGEELAKHSNDVRECGEMTYSSGWRISDTQEPHWRCLTPLNFFDCTMFGG